MTYKSISTVIRGILLNEGYEEDLTNYHNNLDSLKKHHNKMLQHHADKAKEHSNSATLNGTAKDAHHLGQADKHKKALALHRTAADHITMGRDSGMHASKEANKASEALKESLNEEAPAEIVDTQSTENSEPTAADIVAHKYLRRPLHHRMQIQNKIIDNA